MIVIYHGEDDGTGGRWSAFSVGKEPCVIAVYSVHTECLDRNGESGKDVLFRFAKGA